MNEPLHDYIPINVNKLKKYGTYSQTVNLTTGNFTFTFKVNHVARMITVDVADDNGPIIYGEPLILDEPLWRNINNPRLPGESLVPLSNDNDERIDLDNLNQSVFLCIDNLEGDN